MYSKYLSEVQATVYGSHFWGGRRFFFGGSGSLARVILLFPIACLKLFVLFQFCDINLQWDGKLRCAENKTLLTKVFFCP